MPKKAKPLNAKQVEHLKEPGFHAVGGVDGLYLRVYESGARCWVLRYATPEVRYSKAGNPFYARRDLGLGGYPDVSLAKARDKAADYKERIREHGEDPAAQRKEARRRWAESLRRGITFEQAGRKAFAAKAPEFRSKKHRDQWISRLEMYAFPVIGDVPVADVDVNHVMSVLEPIWQTKTETATRVRQRMESVLTWAKVSGYRDGDNPAFWKGNLKELLPNPSKLHKVSHYPALPWKRVPEFMDALRERSGFSARALELVVMTAARSGEVRAATWDEIDMEERVWTIPGDRMKGGLTHRIPLCDDAVALLESLPRLEGEPHVFPAQRGGAMSDMALTSLIRRMSRGADDPWIDPTTGRTATAHGFRSSFKDWCRTRTRYDDEVSELQLAHVNSASTRAAYARDELLERRLALLTDWEAFIRSDEPQTGAVASIREAQA